MYTIRISNVSGLQVSLTSSKPMPVLLGFYLTLTCSVNGSQTMNYTYSWSHNGTNLPEETTPTLVIAGVRTSDIGQYQCTITNDYITGSAKLELYSTGMKR